ncbi:MAG: hypothetical protein AABZ66_05620, partial [Candidatus Binatota bacterium]
MLIPHLQKSLDALLSDVTTATGRILDRALGGLDITVDEAARLFDASGTDLTVMTAAADYLRKKTVGDVVTYVINRNINFTNVCVKACGFCAFSRGHLGEEGYFLPTEEVIRRGSELELHTPNALNARFITPRVAALMVRAGFQSFYLGFESRAY